MKLFEMNNLEREKKYFQQRIGLNFASDEEKLEWYEAYFKDLQHRAHRALSRRDMFIFRDIINVTNSPPTTQAFSVHVRAPGGEEENTTWYINPKHVNLLPAAKRAIEAASMYFKEFHAFERIIRKLKNKIAAERVENLRKQQPKTNTPSTANIPKTIPTAPGTKGISNPYYAATSDRYVGPVYNYPDLSTPMKTMYADLEKALQAAGLNGFTVLYGGRKNKGHISFVAVGADGKFIWKKLGSKYNSVNDVYINGTRMPTYKFLNHPASYLKKLIP